MSTNQQQIAALLKSLIAKGVESSAAVPTLKKLIEAKIFDLKDVTHDNLPADIDPKIRKKLLPPKTKRTAGKSLSGGSPSKRSKKTSDDNGNIIQPPPVTTRPEFVLINRAPVLTLWAAVVAKHKYSKLTLTESMSLASAVAAKMAKAKGTNLGIYQKNEEDGDADAERTDDAEEEFQILGVTVRAKRTKSGIRAMANGEMQNPLKTWTHLEKRFKDDLGYVFEEMNKAAQTAGSPDNLESTSYHYYIHIRPDIPHGTKGWGAHGRLECNNLSNFYNQKAN